MTILVVSILIFMSCFGLALSLLFFFFEAPATRRRLRARLAAVQESAFYGGHEAVDTELLRHDVLSKIPSLNRVLSELPLATKLNLFIHQAALEITVSTLLSISVLSAVAAFILGLLLSAPPVLALLSAGLVFAIPFAVVALRRYRRLSKFEEMFPEAIDMLARAVRAGYAFTNGLELIAREMSDPVAHEFRVTYEQQNLGLPMRDALENLAVRVPIADVRLFVSAIQIQKESGGNLAEVLDKLAQVIRERFKLLRQVKVFTAEGRMSLIILTALPPIAACLLLYVNPDYILRLFTDPIGHQMLAAGIILQIVGFLVIRRIVDLKV